MIFTDAIQKYFSDTLNKNPQGRVFELGQFFRQSGTVPTFDFVPNSLVAYKTIYVPCMIAGVDTPKGVPGKDLYEWVFTLTYALTGEDESIDPMKSERNAIDWFRQKITNDESTSLDVDGVNYNVVHIAYNISLDSAASVVNGAKTTIVSMQIGLQSGIDAIFGNAVKVFLNDPAIDETFYLISKINSGHGINKEASSGMALSGSIVKNAAKDKSYNYNTTIIFEDTPLIVSIAKEILTKGSINKRYIQRIEFVPLGTIPDRDVLLTGGAMNDNTGQFLTVSFDITDKS